MPVSRRSLFALTAGAVVATTIPAKYWLRLNDRVVSDPLFAEKARAAARAKWHASLIGVNDMVLRPRDRA